MPYVIEGLDPAPYRPLFGLAQDALAQRNVRRVTAGGRPGYPCRITLDDAEPGETLLLLNHVSRTGDTPYRASHAIFVREWADRPARYVDTIPPALASRSLSLRGFDAGGMMADAMLTEPGGAEAGLLTLLDNPAIVEIDAHSAARGCFAARVRRA